MKEGFPWQQRKDSNPPKVFYNFIGPKSDELQYVSSFPETDLSLALANGGADDESAAGEANLLGVMERAGHNQEAQDARRIALMRRDKQRFGSDPNRIPFVSLKRHGDRDPTRLVAAPTNPAIRGAGMDHLLSARGRAFSLLGSGSGSKAEKRDLVVAVDASKKAAMEEQGSPSANSNANKKLKAAVQNVETIVIPKPMPHPTTAQGSGSGSFGSDDVILKGYLKKNDADGQVRVVCMCHGEAHTPEEFLKHAGGAHGFNGGSEPTCYVSVSVSVPAHE